MERSAVFTVFVGAFNLEALTPGVLQFKIFTPSSIDIEEDAIIEYRIRLFGIPMFWRTRIDRSEPEAVAN